VLRGNGGNDTLIGGSAFDFVDYSYTSTGVTVISSGSNLVIVTIAAGDTDTFWAIDGVIGGSGDDTIGATYQDSTLRGGGGNDLLSGGTARDTADYSYLSTSFTGTLDRAGTATVVAAVGDTDRLVSIENLAGGSAGDLLVGDGTSNSLVGNGGDDTLRGMGGVDTLFGGAGIDTADYSYATTGMTVTLDSTGTVTALVTATDPDILLSIEGLVGGSGDDIFFGDGWDNRLSGGAGNDTLWGGAGADTLTGGDGADRFAYAADSVGLADVITDFAAGDVLDLDQLLSGLGGLPSEASSYVSFVQAGADVQVRIDQNGANLGNTDTLLATIQNQSAAQVQAQTSFG
jgi:Ca2+-binding RTX toxin-like protein